MDSTKGYIYLIGMFMVFILGMMWLDKAYAQNLSIKPMEISKINSCRTDMVSSSVPTPIITWGADITTLQGNGGLKTSNNSIFRAEGVNLELYRQDVLAKQLKDYMECKTPFLRGTLGMLSLASNVTESDARTQMVFIYQHSWSNGGDALVAKPGINTLADLKGKTIALQAYGPHLDYLLTLLKDAGLSAKDVTLVYTQELTTDANSPVSAFRGNADAAMVISPDAATLTSGSIGTGADGSVRGAKTILSTKTASRVISDVYAVRRDFYDTNTKWVQSFVHGLMRSEERTSELFKVGGSELTSLVSLSAKVLLDNPSDSDGVKGMYADAEMVGFGGNVRFFKDDKWSRNFDKLSYDIQKQYVDLGLLKAIIPLKSASLNYEALKAGLNDLNVNNASFNQLVVQSLSQQRSAQQSTNGDLFKFEINFKPNVAGFPADLYRDQFVKIINLAETYAGAGISVEGHSDPSNYLKRRNENGTQLELTRIGQTLKNLSLNRSQSVVKAIIKYAEDNGSVMDASQFGVTGLGITNPKTGLCKGDPCDIKTEAEWLSNMRVVITVFNVEGEATAFVATK